MIADRQPRAWLAATGLLIALSAGLPLALLAYQAADVHALSLLSHTQPWHLLLRSLGLAAAVTALALTLGVPLGVLFARGRVPLPRTLGALHALPVFLPPFLPALGWFYLFGQQSPWGSKASAALLFSAWGLVAVLSLALAPIVTALTAMGVRAVDPTLEDAARVVARPPRVLTQILLPAAWPSVLLAALLVFALAFSELGVAMFLRVDVYPAAVFARLGGIHYAPGEAAALVLPLLPVAGLLVLVERRLLGRRAFTVLGLRAPRQRLNLGPWTLPATLLCALAALLSALPLLGLAWRASPGLPTVDQWLGDAPLNSLLTATAAASIITLIALVLGHALARRHPGARWIDGATLLAFFTPAAVLGVGLIAVWNRPQTRLIYGSAAILVVGYVARYTVVGVRSFAAAVVQSAPSYEAAATTMGAGYLRRMLHIVVPMHWRAVVATWLLAFVFCLRDVETAVLFYPPGGEPLTVRIFTLEANGDPATVAALALVQVALTLAALGLGALVLRPRRPRR